MRKDLPMKSVCNPIDKTWEENFLKENEELTKLKPLSIVEEFNAFMIDTVCSYRDGVLLPAALGHLFIGVFPNKDNQFLEKRARENELNSIDKEVKYSIQERDGFESRLMYSTAYTGKRCIASKLMGLKPGIHVNAKIEKAFVEDWKRWIVIPNLRLMKNIVILRDTIRGKRKAIEKNLPHYDEFAFDKTE